MQKICPITTKVVDENVARLNGIWTVVIILTYIFTGFLPLLAFLILDFAIRAFFDSRFSYLSLINRYIISSLGIERKIINAGPKVFAAQVGMVLSSASAIGGYLELNFLTMTPAVMLVFFSFLEGAFGICVACKLYPLVRSVFR